MDSGSDEYIIEKLWRAATFYNSGSIVSLILDPWCLSLGLWAIFCFSTLCGFTEFLEKLRFCVIFFLSPFSVFYNLFPSTHIGGGDLDGNGEGLGCAPRLVPQPPSTALGMGAAQETIAGVITRNISLGILAPCYWWLPAKGMENHS